MNRRFFALSVVIILSNFSLLLSEYLSSKSNYLNQNEEVYVIIGEGDSINSPTQAVPVSVYFRSLRGQMVYTVDEMNSAGIEGPALIREIGFYIDSSPAFDLPNFMLRMRHTNAENSSQHIHGPFEIVYFEDYYSPVEGGWDMLELDPPFEWNGVDNILLDSSFSLVPEWSSTGQQRIFPAENGYRFVRSDYFDQTEEQTLIAVNYKPQARFLIETLPPYIYPPENLFIYQGNSKLQLVWDEPYFPSFFEDCSLTGFENIKTNSKKTLNNQRQLLGYNVYRNNILVNNEPIISTNYLDVNLINGVSYTYHVTAVYTHSESEPSNTVSATPLYYDFIQVGWSEEFYGTFNRKLPFNLSFNSYVAQSIYYSDSFYNRIGEIEAIEYSYNFSPNVNDVFVRIWMGVTNETTVPSNYFPYEIFTLVFEGNLSFTSGIHTILIDLDQNFDYYGGNLVIMTNKPYTDNVHHNTRFSLTDPDMYMGTSKYIYSYDIDLDVENLPNAQSGNYQGVASTGFHFTTENIVNLYPPEDLTFEIDYFSIYLDWTAPDTGLDLLGFNLYRNNELLNDEIIEDSVFADYDIECNTYYQYYVTALYIEGESLPSLPVEVLTLESYPSPGNLSAKIIDSSNVKLNWSAPEFPLIVDNEALLYTHPVVTAYGIYRDNQLIDSIEPDQLYYLDKKLNNGVYAYYVTAFCVDIESEPTNTVEIVIDNSDIFETTGDQVITELFKNYPNPFNPDTNVSYSLGEATFVSIEIFNLRGQHIRLLHRGLKNPGHHSLVWDGRDDNDNAVSSGIYYLRMKTEEETFLRKMLLIK